MLYLLGSPLTWALLAGSVLALTRRLTPRRIAWGVMTASLLAATPFGANQLVVLVEQGLASAPACSSEDAAPLVVLTGGYVREPGDTEDFTALNSDSLNRLRATASLALARPDLTVVVSGGPATGLIPEAEVSASLLRLWGLPADRLRLEATAQNTRGNAAQVRRLLGAQVPRVQLLSSALHLPRATLAFRAEQFEVCTRSAGTAYVGPTSLGYVVPQNSALVKSSAVLHEIAGWLLAAVRS